MIVRIYVLIEIRFLFFFERDWYSFFLTQIIFHQHLPKVKFCTSNFSIFIFFVYSHQGRLWYFLWNIHFYKKNRNADQLLNNTLARKLTITTIWLLLKDCLKFPYGQIYGGVKLKQKHTIIGEIYSCLTILCRIKHNSITLKYICFYKYFLQKIFSYFVRRPYAFLVTCC